MDSVREGSVTIASREDLVQLDGVSEVRETLTFAGELLDGDLVFPQLRRVGDVEVTATGLHSLSFPVLEKAGSLDLRDNPQLEELSLPSLERAGGLRGSESLRLLSLPALRTITYLSCWDCAELAQLDAPMLEYAGYLELSQLSSLSSLAFPSLTEAREILLMGAGPTSVAFPVLRSIGTLTAVGDMPVEAWDFPALEQANSIDISTQNAFAFRLDALTRINSLRLGGVPRDEGVRSVSLAQLVSVGELRLDHAFAALTLPRLREAGRLIVEVADELTAPALTSVGELYLSSTAPVRLSFPELERAGAIRLPVDTSACQLAESFPALDNIVDVLQVTLAACP